MKAQYPFAVVALLSVLTTNAQVTYDHTNYAQIGDSLLFSSATALAISPGDAGDSQTWDFSTLEAQSQKMVKFIDPADGGYEQPWCFFSGNLFTCATAFPATTNIAQATRDTVSLSGTQVSNLVDHYLLADSGLYYTITGFTVGMEDGGAIPFAQSYELPDRWYSFPLTYDKQDETDGRYKIDGQSLGFDLIQSSDIHRDNHVDGEGQLITPYGTFDEVLRLYSKISKTDTLIAEGDTSVGQYEEFAYHWFSPDWGVPVLSIQGNVVADTQVVTSVQYLDSLRCLEPMATFTPNKFEAELDSATGEVTIDFFNVSSNATNYSWSFGDGSTTGMKHPTHVYDSAGVYEVSLVVRNQVCDPVEYDTATVTLSIVAYGTLSIATREDSSWEAYPNPTKGQVKFTQPISGAYKLLNISGQTVQAGQLNQATQLDINSLQPGMYWMKLERKGATEVKRLMVQ